MKLLTCQESNPACGACPLVTHTPGLGGRVQGRPITYPTIHSHSFPKTKQSNPSDVQGQKIQLPVPDQPQLELFQWFWNCIDGACPELDVLLEDQGRIQGENCLQHLGYTQTHTKYSVRACVRAHAHMYILYASDSYPVFCQNPGISHAILESFIFVA